MSQISRTRYHEPNIMLYEVYGGLTIKKTEIICTMGPNTSDKNIMMELAKNGMNVARFNFSHGGYEEYQGRLELLKDVCKELDIPIATLLDTKGSEIRTGQLKDGKKVALKEGQTYILTTREVTGDDTIGYINYNGLNPDVAPGNKILIDDDLIEMDVMEAKDTDIICMVANGGEPGERKGMNVPNVKIKLPALTDKDKEDIRFDIKHGFDFITASSVRTADCIREIKGMLEEQGSSTKVIVKIENTEGIENLNAIIEVADDIMVTRGDMDVEIPAEKIPHIQKKIIRKCNEACKIVITAAQMLDFTIRNSRPTRAEVTDVADAVYSGTDTVMLSGEIVMGRYPIEALKMMVSITQEIESRLDYAGYRQRKVTEWNTKNVFNAVYFVSMSIAHGLEVNVIVAPSITEFTTQMPSKWRSGARTIGMSPSMATVRQMQLQWGVVSAWLRWAELADELVESPVERLKNRGFMAVGEPAVITAGVATYARRHEAATQTNIIRVINTG